MLFKLKSKVDAERSELRKRFCNIAEISQLSSYKLDGKLIWKEWLWGACIVRTRFFSADGLTYPEKFQNFRWLKEMLFTLLKIYKIPLIGFENFI